MELTREKESINTQLEQKQYTLHCKTCNAEHSIVLQANNNNINNFETISNSKLRINTKTTQNNISTAPQCKFKDNKEAAVYCRNCESYLCLQCWENEHPAKSTSKNNHHHHSPQTLLLHQYFFGNSDGKNNDENHHHNHSTTPTSRCSAHPQNNTDLYCESCHSLICQICLQEGHQEGSAQHSIFPAATYAEKVKSKLLKRSATILRDSSILQDQIVSCSSYITSCRSQIEDLQSQINNLQKRMEEEEKKKSQLETKCNDLQTMHRILTTTIDQSLSEHDLLNPNLVNHFRSDLDRFLHIANYDHHHHHDNENEVENEIKLNNNINNIDGEEVSDHSNDVSSLIWSLDPRSIKGIGGQYSLRSCKYFEKQQSGNYTAITCQESVKSSPSLSSLCSNHHHKGGKYQWRIQYLPLENENGVLFIGFHANPIASTSSSYQESMVVGWSITKYQYSNNRAWLYGRFIQTERLCASKGDVLTLSLDTNMKIIRLEHPLWVVQSSIHEFKEYYLHFNSLDCSFQLLSCSFYPTSTPSTATVDRP